MAATYAGRRWGPEVEGRFVGLPLTSGPVAFFLILEHGRVFGAIAVQGITAGGISNVAFCLAYAWVAIRMPRPWAAVVAGCIAFFALTAGFDHLHCPVVALLFLILGALGLGLHYLPKVSPFSETPPPPRWDIPVRMGMATTIVLVLTATASWLGPQLSGLVSPFPVFIAVLAAAAHASKGAGFAVNVLRGAMLGLFAFAGFYMMLALILPHSGLALSFVAATATALLVQAATTFRLRGYSATIKHNSRLEC